MPTVTDWLMVGITIVYVIATIIICFANMKSAKATREQVNESIRQFEETKRLECLPFLQLEIPISQERPLFEIELPMYKDKAENTIFKSVVLKNLGNGTATNITYAWKYEPFDNFSSDYPPINAIMRGDQYVFQLSFCIDEIDQETNGILEFQYDDLLGHNYQQKVVLCFKEYDLVRCENDIPK